MKTLYVSDLDGTLLKGDQTLSDTSRDTINYLGAKGMIFTYATARSALTAKKVTEGLFGASFAVVYNGAMVVELKTGEILLKSTFSLDESRGVLDLLLSGGIYPRVFSIIDGKERFTYTPEHLESLGAREYFRTRNNDPRERIGTVCDLYDGEIFTISCVGEKDRLLPFWEKLKGEHQCHFYRDNYSPDWYLEVLPREATKASGIMKLKELLGCERVISFGDGVNDFSMFSAADECYAVEGAHPDLKAIATGVIGSNEEDGVAHFLLSHFKGQ